MISGQDRVAGPGRRDGDPPGPSGLRRWRRARPFWAGLWTVLSGVVLLSVPAAPLGLLVHEGVAGVSGPLMGLSLVVLGLALWLAPGCRVLVGIATLVCAVASLILSNLGGFLLGFALGVLGGALAVGWAPDGERGLRAARDPDDLDSTVEMPPITDDLRPAEFQGPPSRR